MKIAASSLLAVAVVVAGQAADAPNSQSSTQQVATLSSLVDPLLVNTRLESGRQTSMVEQTSNVGLGTVSTGAPASGVGAPTGRPYGSILMPATNYISAPPTNSTSPSPVGLEATPTSGQVQPGPAAQGAQTQTSGSGGTSSTATGPATASTNSVPPEIRR